MTVLILISVKSDRVENPKKLLSLLNSPPSFCVEYKISSKLKHLPFFVQNFQNYGLTSINIDRRQKLQKNYCHHWIQHPRFVQSTKFLQNRRICHYSSKAMASKMTVPTLASVKNHKKLSPLVNSAPSNCSLRKISWKIANLISRSLFPIPRCPF